MISHFFFHLLFLLLDVIRFISKCDIVCTRWCQHHLPRLWLSATEKRKNIIFSSWMWISCFGMHDMNCNSAWYTCHSILIVRAYFPCAQSWKCRMLHTQREREKNNSERNERIKSNPFYCYINFLRIQRQRFVLSA